MDKLTVALNRVHETLDALRTAITELEIEASITHDRLRRVLNQDETTREASVSRDVGEQYRHRPRPLDYIAWGDTVAVDDVASHEAREREQRSQDARYGRPTELRDII